MGQVTPRTAEQPASQAGVASDTASAARARERVRGQELEAQAGAAFRARNWRDARVALEELRTLRPASWIVRYNLACAYGAEGKTDDAVAHLEAAIDLGFFDQRRLLREPALREAIAHRHIAPLLEDWNAVLQRQADVTLRGLERQFGGPDRAEQERDPGMRMVGVGWVDEDSFEQALHELRELHDWSVEDVFGDLLSPGVAGAELDPVIAVAIPPRDRFRAWVEERFGAGGAGMLSQVGGAYEHEFVRLVSMDLGATLRHEFMHALHWRACLRLGQSHPIWILEGLASLVEDMDQIARVPVPGGPSVGLPRPTPVPSWRTNTAKRMDRSGSLLPLAQFAALDHHEFNSQRPLAKYAQARAFFLFLFQRGWLAAFFTTYMTDREQGWYADPSGLNALTKVTGMGTAELDATFRVWLRELPLVPEEVGPGMASLGVSVESGPEDGLLVVHVPQGRREGRQQDEGLGRPRRMDPQRIDPRDPRGGARRPSPGGVVGVNVTPLRVGDVIVALDGRSTRDIAELIRILGTYPPGALARVTVRRGDRELDLAVRLIAKE